MVVPVLIVLLLSLVLRAGPGTFRVLVVPPAGLPPGVTIAPPVATAGLPFKLDLGIADAATAQQALADGAVQAAVYLARGALGVRQKSSCSKERMWKRIARSARWLQAWRPRRPAVTLVSIEAPNPRSPPSTSTRALCSMWWMPSPRR
ncbi:MAG: hypothetical protein FJ029_05555 [Actinobacteria bacterium]|nr:hypothetical protein [Actinomycetota bacterium]